MVTLASAHFLVVCTLEVNRTPVTRVSLIRLDPSMLEDWVEGFFLVLFSPLRTFHLHSSFFLSFLPIVCVSGRHCLRRRHFLDNCKRMLTIESTINIDAMTGRIASAHIVGSCSRAGGHSVCGVYGEILVPPANCCFFDQNAIVCSILSGLISCSISLGHHTTRRLSYRLFTVSGRPFFVGWLLCRALFGKTVFLQGDQAEWFWRAFQEDARFLMSSHLSPFYAVFTCLSHKFAGACQSDVWHSTPGVARPFQPKLVHELAI